MTQSYWIAGLILFFLFACNGEQKNKKSSDSTALNVRFQDSVDLSGKTNQQVTSNEPDPLFEYATNFSVCYSEYRDRPNDYSYFISKKGYSGKFNGKDIYYELWEFNNGNYTGINYLILKTDTNKITQYDFCFPDFPSPEECVGKILCKRLDSARQEWIIDTTLKVNQIPGILAVPIAGPVSASVYSGENNKDPDQAKLYFKGQYLYIEYWNAPRYGDHELIRDTYVWKNDDFIFESKKTLKTAATTIRLIKTINVRNPCSPLKSSSQLLFWSKF